MNELIKVNYENDNPTVSGRELHELLEVSTEYRHWFPRMCEYGFSEGVDFNPFKNDRVQKEGDREVVREIIDHQLTIDMAKELCMLQRNEKGKQARQYFIELEKAWNQPEQVMARALRIADTQIKQLQTANAALISDNQTLQPKADYFDELVDRNLLTSFRDTANQLKIKQNIFINFLIDRKYIYRDRKGKLMPYADKNNGLFEIKEAIDKKTKWSGTQTLITPKGRETFRLLFSKAGSY